MGRDGDIIFKKTVLRAFQTHDGAAFHKVVDTVSAVKESME